MAVVPIGEGRKGRRAAVGSAAVLATGLLLSGGVGAGQAVPTVSVSPAVLDPGEQLTISGVDCPPSDWDGEQDWRITVHNGRAGDEPLPGEVTDPDPSETASLGWTLEGWPGRILEGGTPAADGSWSVTVPVPDDAEAGSVPMAATCHTGQLADGLVRYGAAVYEVNAAVAPEPEPPPAPEPAPAPVPVPVSIQPTLTG